MPLVSDRCICLRKHEYSETSQILTLFSRERGIFRVMAKGAHRRTKAGAGKFDGGIDLMDAGHAVFSDDPGRDLGLLTDWKLQEGHLGLRNRLRPLYLAIYAVELIGLLLEEHDPHPELFDLLEQLLGDLQTAKVEEAFLAFELDLLRASGFTPELAACGNCGGSLRDRDVAYYSAARGGVICQDCHAAFADRLELDIRLLRLMRLIQASPGTLANRRLPRLTRHQTDPINHLLLQHLEHALGRRPRAAYYILSRRNGGRQASKLACNPAGQGA
jgi:DNA repair protein RecO (recombination protein O)